MLGFRPVGDRLFDGLSGKRLAAIPLGACREALWRPYLTLHRADLQAALHAACAKRETVTLRPRFEVGRSSARRRSVVARRH